MYRKWSAGGATSTARAWVTGLPLSIDSSSANSSIRSSISSRMRQTIRLRSDGLILPQGPSTSARRAAATAKSTSTPSPLAAVEISAPVAGSNTGNVSPVNASMHLPSMRCPTGRPRKAATGGDRGWERSDVSRAHGVSCRRGWVLGDPSPAVRRSVEPRRTAGTPSFEGSGEPTLSRSVRSVGRRSHRRSGRG